MLYNWNHPDIPEWVNYIATDNDGSTYGFRYMPKAVALAWYQEENDYPNPNLALIRLPSEVILGDTFPIDWRDSLEAYPMTQPQPQLDARPMTQQTQLIFCDVSRLSQEDLGYFMEHLSMVTFSTAAPLKPFSLAITVKSPTVVIST